MMAKWMTRIVLAVAVGIGGALVEIVKGATQRIFVTGASQGYPESKGKLENGSHGARNVDAARIQSCR